METQDMDTSFEKKLEKALQNPEDLKTPNCPDTTTIGLLIENKLPELDAAKIRAHIGSCIYCLDNVSDMRALLYFKDKWTPIPYQFLTKLENLYHERKQEVKKPSVGFLKRILDVVAAVFTFPFKQWRYATVCALSVICTVFVLSYVNDMNVTGRQNILSAKNEMNFFPAVNHDVFVDIQAMGSNGNVLRSMKGVIVDSKGMVAANLSPLAGASAVKIVLKNGKSYEIKSMWRDDGKNIALMKIEENALPSFKIADLRQIGIGEKVFFLDDSYNVKDAAREAVISDFKSATGRRSGADIQYIQFVSFASEKKRGFLVDKEGRLIGLSVSEEKNINFAAPLNEAFKLAKLGKAVNIGELKNANYSVEALNFYFKGIIAKNSNKYDEAIEYFKRAIEINPNLEYAHIELGFLYYKKRLYDLEKKAYEEAMRINPDNTDAMFYLATNLETRGYYDEAAQLFEKITAVDPEDADAFYELGLAYIARGQKAKAVDVCEKLQKLDAGLAGKLRAIALKR